MAPKVFGIGLNKTGTTSLGICLKALGYNHKSWDPAYFAEFQRGKTQKLVERTIEFDSFVDWPWPLLVNELLDEYSENARFILTKRKDEYAWLKSLKKQSKITPPDDNPRRKIFGYSYPHENEMHHLWYYSAHIESVRLAFERRRLGHMLLEVCWETGDGWPEVCQYLDKPIPRVPFPHENPSRFHMRRTLTTLENKQRIAELSSRPWYKDIDIPELVETTNSRVGR